MRTNQSELIVHEFCDVITTIQKPVKHAAYKITNKALAKPWEWDLTGAYIIANSQRTLAYTCDGLRLARFTTSPISLTCQHHFIGFCKGSSENEAFYYQFDQIFDSWSIVQNCAIYEKEHLIVKSRSGHGITMKILDLTIPIAHILDFCHATQDNLITCLAVINQSNATSARLKLVAGPLEELLMPII